MEIATFEWVDWWNESRPHQSLGYHTPAEVEVEFWEHYPSREMMEIKAHAQEQNPGHFKLAVRRSHRLMAPCPCRMRAISGP
ncbi:integrase core domain-containing protein [Corynebacterium striatum]|uniref:integrase core domain-containing protein n=1 Tax=Corynebacterium striatum TaxID=43770 RepID=UPI003B5C620F